MASIDWFNDFIRLIEEALIAIQPPGGFQRAAEEHVRRKIDAAGAFGIVRPRPLHKNPAGNVLQQSLFVFPAKRRIQYGIDHIFERAS